MSEPVAVRVRDCACPDTPHAESGDLVYLRPVLSLEGGLAILAAMRRLPTDAEGRIDTDALAPALGPLYVRHGAIGWNLTNGTGGPVPFDVQRLLDDYGLAYDVAEKADDLYGEAVLAPLLRRIAGFSLPGQTAPSISASQPSRQSRRRRSARSSPGNSGATLRSVS